MNRLENVRRIDRGAGPQAPQVEQVYPTALARVAAYDLLDALRPAAMKIALAGSLRRCDKHLRTSVSAASAGTAGADRDGHRAPSVIGDIEICCVPAPADPAWRPPEEPFRLRSAPPPRRGAAPANSIEQRLVDLMDAQSRPSPSSAATAGSNAKELSYDAEQPRNGPRWKRLRFRGIPVDLFLITPPAQWGVLFAIRTGPAEWSKALVTRREWGGLLPDGMKVHEGQLWHWSQGTGRTWIPCADEAQFFAAIGVPCLPPEDRTRAALERLQQGARRKRDRRH